MKYSHDGIVGFDHDTHTYWKGADQLKGVTTFISQYKTPFDIEEVATTYAKKNGLNRIDIMAGWKEKGRIAREDGTAVHNFIEAYCETNIFPEVDSPKKLAASAFIARFFMSGRLIPVAVEEIVYGRRLASQIDMIAKNPAGEHFILDWKTSKEISRESYGKFMKMPYTIPDCTFNHYSLQLSIYRQLCTRYEIKDTFIVHLKETGFELIKADFIPTSINLL